MQVVVAGSKPPKAGSVEGPSPTAPMFHRTLSEALLVAHNNSTSLDDVKGPVSSMHVGPVATAFSSDSNEKCPAQLAVHEPHARQESAAPKIPGSLRVISSSSGQVRYTPSIVVLVKRWFQLWKLSLHFCCPSVLLFRTSLSK